MKDWTGGASVIIGQNNRNDYQTDHDYYATDPLAMEELLKVHTFNHEIWECACGEGHLSKVLQNAGYNVYSSDLIYRGFGDPEPFDFLVESLEDFNGDIVTNPPYKYAQEFVEKALEDIKDGNQVAMFLKLSFLSSKSRKRLFDTGQLKYIYIFRSRVECAKNGIFEGKRGVDYGWFIWQKGFKGEPIVRWIN